MYDIHMHLIFFNTKTNDGSEYITIFNINTRKSIHIICVYRVHSCSISKFLHNLQIIIQLQPPKHCLIIIMGDFNVGILNDNNQAKNKQKLLYFMDKFQLKSQFSENTTKVGFWLNHIWTNVLRNEFKSSIIEAYWLKFYKSIYIAFKLPITLSMYNEKPSMFPFI